MKTAHPFLDRESLVIVGDHVTLESGTGCVHTAPGHGVEDFEVCQNYQEIPMIVPVDHKGVLTEEAGRICRPYHRTTPTRRSPASWRRAAHLFALEKIIHQYPHCWRCKQPDPLPRDRAVVLLGRRLQGRGGRGDSRTFSGFPAWGEDRITNMVTRPLRLVHLPSAHLGRADPDLLLRATAAKRSSTTTTMRGGFRHVPQGGLGRLVRHEAERDPACRGVKSAPSAAARISIKRPTSWTSGSTPASPTPPCWMERDVSSAGPADLYLEGADQYRGWFQSSLLTSVA